MLPTRAVCIPDRRFSPVAMRIPIIFSEPFVLLLSFVLFVALLRCTVIAFTPTKIRQVKITLAVFCRKMPCYFFIRTDKYDRTQFPPGNRNGCFQPDTCFPTSESRFPCPDTHIPNSGCVYPGSGGCNPTSENLCPNSGRHFPCPDTQVPTSGTESPSRGRCFPTTGIVSPNPGKRFLNPETYFPKSGSVDPNAG